MLYKIKSEKGAMDKILVTLLFIIIGVGSLVALEQWFSNQRSDLLNSSENVINTVRSETGSY